MSGAAGSSNLTEEQTAWFLERTGKRYVTVQTDADTPSRAMRRLAARQQRRRPDGKPYGG